MAKSSKTQFFCQHCGQVYPQWRGQCGQCFQWNTIVEEVIHKTPTGWTKNLTSQNKPLRLSDIRLEDEDRVQLNDIEFNRVLGGGLVKGSVVLIGGEPGIGKSTLTLQLALQQPQLKVLYVSGEESLNQIRLRAQRLQSGNGDPQCYLFAETQTSALLNVFNELMPSLIIIDSIQTMVNPIVESAAGSVSQIKESTAQFIQFAKSYQIPIIIIGHINKDGHIAGPKLLEHMVDVVLQFEGDAHYNYRLLRAYKNRFGSTGELGIYEMSTQGLLRVSNPSQWLISQKDESLSGHAIAANIDGQRPLFIEVQALVSAAVFGTPQRSANGFDAKRLNMLLAVLEKRAGFRLSERDVFLNITGGIKLDDPSADLSVAVAIISSHQDLSIPEVIAFAGEIGLSGEIRPVHRLDARIAEAEKLGYKTLYVSKNSNVTLKSLKINIEYVSKVDDLLPILSKCALSHHQS